MGKQATLRDIAQHCGLSIATVSRVLSDSSYVVSDATRKRVLDSARQLNYTPNELGKSLKTRSTRDIGVILPNITNPYYAPTVPSTIFRSACCTPSPDTSLVMDTFSLLRVILSISSIYMIPCSARSIS